MATPKPSRRGRILTFLLFGGLLVLGGLLVGALVLRAGGVDEQETTYVAYGAASTPEDAVPARTVADEPAAYVGEAVKVAGTAAAVCQKKGCWLTLETSPDQPPIRVLVAREADGSYAFTVPTDLQGQRVVVQGRLTEETLSEDVQRHFAEDAGEDVNRQTFAPRTELRIVAESVLLENDA